MAGELYDRAASAVNANLARTGARDTHVGEAIVPALLRATFQPPHERRPPKAWPDAPTREPMLPTPPGAVVHAVADRLGAESEAGCNVGDGQVLVAWRGIGAGVRGGR